MKACIFLRLHLVINEACIFFMPTCFPMSLYFLSGGIFTLPFLIQFQVVLRPYSSGVFLLLFLTPCFYSWYCTMNMNASVTVMVITTKLMMMVIKNKYIYIMQWQCLPQFDKDDDQDDNNDEKDGRVPTWLPQMTKQPMKRRMYCAHILMEMHILSLYYDYDLTLTVCVWMIRKAIIQQWLKRVKKRRQPFGNF